MKFLRARRCYQSRKAIDISIGILSFLDISCNIINNSNYNQQENLRIPQNQLALAISATLQTMYFTKAAITDALVGISSTVQCKVGSGNPQTNDVRTYADLLKGKGGQSCAVEPHGGSSPPQMCHQGTARVYGVSNNG